MVTEHTACLALAQKPRSPFFFQRLKQTIILLDNDHPNTFQITASHSSDGFFLDEDRLLHFLSCVGMCQTKALEGRS